MFGNERSILVSCTERMTKALETSISFISANWFRRLLMFKFALIHCFPLLKLSNIHFYDAARNSPLCHEDFPPLIIHILRCMVIFKLNFIFKLSELRGSQWGQPIAVKRPKI